MLILLGVTLWVGMLCLAVLFVNGAAEKHAGVDSFLSVRIIHDMKLSLGKKYQTRSGCPVRAMDFSASNIDGFPWHCVFVLPSGKLESQWYTDEGRWSNNFRAKSELDLVEVKA